jgi:hypothetical protein
MGVCGRPTETFAEEWGEPAARRLTHHGSANATEFRRNLVWHVGTTEEVAEDRRDLRGGSLR